MRARTTVAISLGLLMLAPSSAQADARGTLELRFTTDRPGAPSGVLVHVTYPPPPGSSKPSPIEDLRIDGPAGTRIDPAAVPVCTATDDQIRLGGLGACPRGSRIGHGKLVAHIGLPFDPVTFDVVAVAAPAQIIELVMVPGTDLVLALDRLRVEGATLTAHPPATPGGPPDFRTAVGEVELLLDAAPLGRPSVVTTPPACADGRWTSSGRFTFADGVVSLAGDTAPCAVPAKAAKRRPPSAKRHPRRTGKHGRRPHVRHEG